MSNKITPEALIELGFEDTSLHTKHLLEYSIWSCKVSWCPKCNKHFYNERNSVHTTKSTSEHFHILD